MELTDRINAMLRRASNTLELAASTDIADAVLTLRETVQTLREELLDLRDTVSTLQEEKMQIAKRLAELTDFNDERKNYALVALPTGAVVYVERGAGQREIPVAEPVQDTGQRKNQRPIYLCAHCFERAERSYLQLTKPDFRRDTYSCNVCGSTVLIPNSQEMTVMTTGRRADFDGF